jgi:hypothetical protein
MLCLNKSGEFEKPFVEERSAKPSSFRNIKTRGLPVTWTFNTKAWMNSVLFKEWISWFPSGSLMPAL